MSTTTRPAGHELSCFEPTLDAPNVIAFKRVGVTVFVREDEVDSHRELAARNPYGLVTIQNPSGEYLKLNDSDLAAIGSYARDLRARLEAGAR